jgi:predicted ATP-grasp superfamily ATP-dependent carboligase
MSRPSVSERRLLVTADEFHASLALVRGLYSAGYVPLVAVSREDTYVARSRCVREVLHVSSPENDAATFTREVADVARAQRVAFVLPGTEASLLALARHRSTIETPVAAPDAAVVELATDKVRVLELAQTCGLDIPPSVVGSPASLAARATEVTYPAILKPHRSRVQLPGQRLTLLKAISVESAGALRVAVDRLPPVDWVLQPRLLGELSAVSGVAWRGRLVCAVHQRSPRIWPAEAGISAYAETIGAEPGLERRVAQLIEAIGWSGIFQLQMIRTRDGRRVLIDFNPRAYGSLALAVGAGANLPAVWAALVTGETPPRAGYEIGVRYRLESADVRAILALARSGAIAAALGAMLPRRRTVHAIVSRQDRGPTRVAAARALARVRR